jgi:hypothetical protein
MNVNNRLKHIVLELKEHVGYTVLSVAIGVGIMVVLSGVLREEVVKSAKEFFHFFHPIHLFLSIAATTAMVYRHSHQFISSIVIGFVCSVGICGISDIFLPFISGIVLGGRMLLHICVVEHIGFIFPFLIFGTVIGLIVPQKTIGTIFTHSLHVLISSMASLLYLISFGLTNWRGVLGGVFVYVFLSVLIPCCMSDIILPLFFVEREKGL